MKLSTRNPYFSLLSTAWQYARRERWRYLLIYSLFFVATLSSMALPVVFGWFIEQMQLEGTDAIASAWKYIGLLMALHFFYWSLHFPGRIMERALAFRLSRNMLEELYHKTLQLPVAWHQDHHSGNTINRVRKAYEALKTFFDFGFAYFSTVVSLVFALVGILYFAPLFGGIAIGISVLIFAMIMQFDKPFIAATMETNERENELSSALFDSLSNIATVITLRLEKRMETNIGDRIQRIWPPFKRVTYINESKWFSVGTAIRVLYAVIVLGYIYRNYVPGEVFLVGGLVTLIGFIDRFNGVFRSFAYQYTQVVRFHADVESAKSILEAYDAYYQPSESGHLPEHWRQLTIQDLTFRHASQAPTDAAALQNIHLDTQRGQRIALIGESGSGKSTLMAVLRGLHQAASIDIRVDGKQIPALSDRVTLIPQEPEIFEHTIRYNITLGLPIDQAEIDRVVRLAAFQEVVDQLPEGLESNIKEKGVNLSGGQKQRLALARGILAAQRSDIILCDEPTSSVDPKTELEVYRRLFAEFSDKLLISSLHRLHLLPHFHQVYLMDQGRVIAVGTFEELLRHNAAFQRLWAHQEDVLML